jgi:hypothetical protein
VSGLKQWTLESVRARGIDVTDEGIEIHDGAEGVRSSSPRNRHNYPAL